MRSKSKSQSTLNSSMDKSQIFTDEEINDIIKDITLKQPKSSYSIYITEKLEKEREKGKIVLGEMVKKYAAIWNKLPEQVKENYQEKSNQEREKYIKDLETVKRYLIKNYFKEGATSYRIFLESKLKEGFDEDKEPKKIKEEARDEWKNMTREERSEWHEKKRENDNWWTRAKTSRNINSYAVFVQKKIHEEKEKGNQLDFKDISKLWKKLSEKDKNKYRKYADEMNEERRQIREVYEIVHGIKPKQPAGAYRIFLTEMAKEGKFEGKNAFKEGKKLWDKTSEEEKEKYLKISHKLHLCYKYKVLLYKKNKRKMRPTKAPTAYNLFVADMKGKAPKKEKFFDYVKDEWEKLDEKVVKEYQRKADKFKSQYAQKMKEFNNKIFDNPKKPQTSYQLFIVQKIPELKEKNPKKTTTELMIECASEWNELDNKGKKKYEQKSKIEREIYKENVKEFEEKGYYTNKKKSSLREAATASQSQKKKSQSLSKLKKKIKA